MVAWMISAILIAAAMTFAAYAFERSLQFLGLQIRHAWTFGICATFVVPFIPNAAAQPFSRFVPQITTATLDAITPSRSLSQTMSLSDVAVTLWVIASCLIAAFYLLAYLRLAAARRAWRSATIAGREVLVSDTHGPAIVGFVRPRVVVPEWVSNTPLLEQQLIVQHESEHIHAKDHLLVLMSVLATTIMPWNPFVWLQTRRLRFALEADCDQRVLASGPDRACYASLLVQVGARHAGLGLSAALAEHRHGLEQRIAAIIAARAIRNWKRAALSVVLGLFMTVFACDLNRADPLAPDNSGRVANQVHPVAVLAPQQQDPNAGPVFTPHTVKPSLNNRDEMMRALTQSYPPLLRDAGIRGTTIVWLLLDERGEVLKASVKQSSGRRELDSAAVSVALKMKFTPALNGDVPVKIWIGLPIAFRPD